MARPAKTAIPPTKRDGFWYLERRVPKRFHAVEKRRIVHLSTTIRIVDDPRAIKATQVAADIDAALHRTWQAALNGAPASPAISHDQAKHIAHENGVPYLTLTEIADLPLGDILKRLELLHDANTSSITKDNVRRGAILGLSEPRQFFVSDLIDEFQKIETGIYNSKSPNQKRKWRVARQTALNDFTLAIGGDRPLNQLQRAHVLRFREYLQQRVAKEEITIESANKYIGYVSGMYNKLSSHWQLDHPAIFKKSILSGGGYSQRVAFDTRFVEAEIFAPGVLDELNTEAHAIVCMIAETGMRLSEVCNLNGKTIHLDAPVPYVSIRPDGRRLKTPNAARDIPLVAIALEALKSHPEGFPRYVDKAPSLSALVNKYLRNRGLLPVEGQTLYSLRHAFEDRLQAAEAPEKLIADLMGHKWYRPRYGAGPTLEQKAKWIERVAYKVTARPNDEITPMPNLEGHSLR